MTFIPSVSPNAVAFVAEMLSGKQKSPSPDALKNGTMSWKSGNVVGSALIDIVTPATEVSQFPATLDGRAKVRTGPGGVLRVEGEEAAAEGKGGAGADAVVAI